MTISIVDLETGQFKHNSGEPFLRDPEGNLRPTTKIPEFGWFDFIPANNTPPENKKAGGTYYDVDLQTGTVTERIEWIDLTVDEIKERTNAAIDAQILALEKQAIELGLLRTVMEDLRDRALEKAAALGLTEAALLDESGPAYSPPYAKLHKNIADRATLRAQRL